MEKSDAKTISQTLHRKKERKMSVQNSAFKTKSKEKPKREELTMSRELELKLRPNLIITSLDGEGLIFEEDTRKVFWINETAAFLLRLFEANHEGTSLSSAKTLLEEQYAINDGEEIAQDLTHFISQLERYGLVSVETSSNGTNRKKLKNPNNGTTRSYLKPMIDEETSALPIAGAAVRAARMAASRSAAVSRATAAGFRGFK